LEKQHKNEFAKYKFTSSDDFKDAIRPLLAKHGLWIRMQERDLKFQEVRNDKEKQTFVAVYHFTIQLCHASGGEEPEHITVALPFTGAQTTGAARSYAVKEWFKGKFLMSSGDIDAEADLTGHDTGDRLSKAEARETYTGLQAELATISANADTAQEIADWYKENEYRVKALPKDWEVSLHTAAIQAWKAFVKAPKPANNTKKAKLEPVAMPSPDAAVLAIELGKLQMALADARTVNELDALETVWTARTESEDWPDAALEAIYAAFSDRRLELFNNAEPPLRNPLMAG
jgi:hypothetical protein